MAVDDEEFGHRPPAVAAPRAAPARGYNRLCIDHGLQANRRADLDFLAGASGHEPPCHNH